MQSEGIYNCDRDQASSKPLRVPHARGTTMERGRQNSSCQHFTAYPVFPNRAYPPGHLDRPNKLSKLTSDRGLGEKSRERGQREALLPSSRTWSVLPRPLTCVVVSGLGRLETEASGEQKAGTAFGGPFYLVQQQKEREKVGGRSAAVPIFRPCCHRTIGSRTV